MAIVKALHVHSWTISFFPNHITQETILSKHLIAQKFQLSLLIIIYRNKNNASI